MSARSGTSLGSERDPRPTMVGVGRLDEQPGNVRQCGRCRESFPGDPTLHPVAKPDWWLCPPCREALFGHAESRVAGTESGVEVTSC